jgi:hypothetical protein
LPDITTGDIVSKSQRKALSAHRRRLKRRGIARLELRVKHADIPLVRGVVDALSDPARAEETRSLLRERFGAGNAKGLKRLLAQAPLEDFDLTRPRDFGRDVET